MKTLTAFVLLAVFTASCTAAPLPDHLKQVRSGTSQPELSARDPFNIGQLSQLNSLGAALVEPDPETLARAGAGTPDPELSARDPFKIGELSHLNQISASAVDPDRDESLALRDLQSLSEGELAARHALAERESRFRLPGALQNNLRLPVPTRFRFAARSPLPDSSMHLPPTLQKNLRPGAGTPKFGRDILKSSRAGDNVAHARAGTPELEISARDPFNIGEISHLNSISASAVEPDRDDSLALRDLPNLNGGGSAGETTKHELITRASSFRLPSILEKNLLLGAGSSEIAHATGPTDNLASAPAHPELSARDPFNIGELSHLNYISASAEEPDRDDSLALRDISSLSGGGSAGETTKNAHVKRASAFHLPSNAVKNLILKAPFEPAQPQPSDNLENAVASPELSARDPFNIGGLSHLNTISADAVKPDQARQDGGLTLRELQSLGGVELAGETTRHALAKRALDPFHIPSKLENILLRGASAFPVAERDIDELN